MVNLRKPNNKETMNETTYDKLADLLAAAIESQVSYETEHEDAGNNYLGLLREGDCLAIQDRLEAYLKEQEIDYNQDTLGDLLDYCLDWSEPLSGHIFSTLNCGGFDVEGWPIQEVEIPFSVDCLERVLEIEGEELKAFVALALEDRRFCLRGDQGGLLSYEATDCVWIAHVPKETLEDVANDLMSDWLEAQEED